jgi:hypothetical protein
VFYARPRLRPEAAAHELFTLVAVLLYACVCDHECALFKCCHLGLQTLFTFQRQTCWIFVDLSALVVNEEDRKSHIPAPEAAAANSKGGHRQQQQIRV